MSLSQQTLIIIIVCASVGGIIFFVLLYRCLRSRTRSSLAPLPPVQPLAHHREYQVASYTANRTSTWYDPHGLPPVVQPFASGGDRSSKSSLLGPDTPSVRHPSSSYGTPEELSALAPLEASPFPTGNPSSASVNSDLDEFGALPRPRPRSRSASRTGSSTPRRPRPLSTASVGSAAARNMIRGTPHGPHSQVQIVLPAPLAPDLAQFINADSTVSRPHSRYESDAGDRLSVVDKWLSTGSRSGSSSGSRPSSSAGDPRMSISTASTNSQPSHRVLRRSTSDTAYSPTQTPSPQSILAPPVPRIPSMYSTYTPDDTELSTYRSDRTGTPQHPPRLTIARNEASSPGPRSGDSSAEDSQTPFILSPVR
ncbi:hypothetical protein BDN72DRAFT_830054 [Pluteus cervinus]|uniref:Uncharacterized protein n=1 Tax=Pluteus cervinus TaxID=181527 RepID=A0ACD3BFB2_9AGAR|nr:hypothetical protein BDN72DRAFT_830054 [Pluteus cervinus]